MKGSKEKQITKKSKSSFYLAFSILPKEKREAIYTLYSFCRQTDDIADNSSPLKNKQLQLDTWERDLQRQFSGEAQTRFQKLWSTAQKFRIPYEYFLELVKGVRMDLLNSRFQNFEELKTYCYRVASIVGLMSIQIFGYRDERVQDYAVNLGIALQLTNIIRDVGVDAEMGRVYLPQEDMERFGVSERDILEKRNTLSFKQLMHYEYERAKFFYRRASELLPRSERRNMIPSQIMKNIYFYLLNSIAKNQFNVLQQKIEIPSFVKFSIAVNTLVKETLLSIA